MANFLNLRFILTKKKKKKKKKKKNVKKKMYFFILHRGRQIMGVYTSACRGNVITM